MKKLLFTIIFFPLLCGAIELHNDVFEKFRAAEQQSWVEYIHNAATVSNDSSIDIRFYHINIDVAIHKKFIRGHVLVQFDSRIDNLAHIRLDLQRSFQVDSITGAAASFQHQNDVLTVSLAQSLNAGDSASMHIFYHGEPPIINGLKGLRYEKHGFNEPIIANLSTPFLAHYWWPCKDGPGDKADSVYIDVTIPDTTIRDIPLIAVSNGTLDSTSVKNNKKTFHWRERYPIVPYYVNMAISNYTPFSHWSGGVRRKGVLMQYNVFSESRERAFEAFATFFDVMNFFEQVFGTYPFQNEKYAMSELGYYGGIEKQTNTIMGGMDIAWYGVAVHELAHMWFGDMITCASWHHGWLNEGFATYAEALWYEHVYGREGYQQFLQNAQFFDGGTLYLQDTSDPFAVFIPIIYNKGAWVLHMLRGILGDQLFFKALKSYAADPRFRFDHATTKDFQDVCEKVSGLDLSSFFEQWIYGAYFPFYAYSFWQESTNRLNVRINQTQVELGRQLFEMPVQLLVQFKDGSDSLITVRNNEKSQQYSFDFSKRVANVVLDPDFRILRKTRLQTSVEENSDKPLSFRLYQNYPNPFNSSTMIKYDVPNTEDIKISVLNARGQHVKTVLHKRVERGAHEVLWHGRDDNGELVSSGIYFIRLQSAAFQKTIKAALLE